MLFNQDIIYSEIFIDKNHTLKVQLSTKHMI